MGRFGVGQGLRRVEDVRFLTGQGRYSDDIKLDGQAYGVLLRSPYAHAEIRAIDLEEARALPGVLGIFTAEDLSADGVGDIPCLAPMPGKGGGKTVMPPHPALARGRVRHVGDPVVFVVAETQAQARDAADLVMIDYDDLPAVIDTGSAKEAGQPQIWAEAPDNTCLVWEMGNEAGTKAAFDKAHHVTSLEFVNNRVVVNAMEPRGTIGDYDAATETFTLYTGNQGSHRMLGPLSRVFNTPQEKLRVISPDVGGGFGMKIFVYPETVLVLFAARRLGRPVRWISERSEGFLSDTQGRDHVTLAELALDENAKALGLRVTTTANMGAYLSAFAPYIPTGCYGPMLSGLYSIPVGYTEVICVFTNTVPVDAYRGAGRPEAAYMIERLMDAAARDLGLAPEELRRRNFIAADALPFTTAFGETYDSGNFGLIMEKGLEAIDAAGFAGRRAEAAARGKLRGLSFASYGEVCGSNGEETAQLKLREDGGVTLWIGTQSNGQGHYTAYTQLLADKLGLEPEQIEIHQGDSWDLPQGGGTGGSRSLLMGGRALDGAADKVIERSRRVAGHLLEAAEADIEFAEGIFTVAGTDRRVTLAEVAKAAGGGNLPEEIQEPLEDQHHVVAEAQTYPNGCHLCELEVDPETGVTSILRYVVIDDFGTLVNPMMVAGQVHGGTAQGIGQALLEHTVYDENGQLLSGSFMDYCMPRADDMPSIELTMIEDMPCATNPMGVKGAGEAGAIGACPAVINALVDALSPLGIRHIDMPATPEKVWRAIQDAHEQRAAE
ncbi:xanthine dehydrogenase family protein molybdopterin-binding subunit [Pelagibius litoralis]|uniref:Xanthine dehydrogenase family protein molybdopterin-binding subunit n=1 Tax=Pelagibius litoralis TaxID=374515 RepID=A0A967KAZ8_9PROT|nr:xanthine dehydrogenase family protein molybdopterin-binding subunit [Pelagibius litoralis]NIA70767.1 xanthine dehydrogenase family protein molybdopterin-binding subunit [Pelagibius litoralis]